LDRKTLVVTPCAEIHPPLNGFEDVTFAMRNTGAFALTYKTSEHSVEELLDRVRAAGVAIKDLSIEEPDLEDVFVELTA
jgi:ABC-2 type transport system ATP-binding protein